MKSTLFKDYEAFIAVATAGSFNGGARLLEISPSAMSQIIRRLEERTGVQLFHRTTRSVSTTDQGAQLLARLSLAFQEIEAATRELSWQREHPVGNVRLVMPRVAWNDLIAPRLATFHTSYPEITLEVRLDDAWIDIVSEGYDIGFRLGEYIHPETVAFPVGPALRQIPVASPDYLAANGTPEHPRDLARHRCINWRQQPDASPYNWEFSKGSEKITLAVQGPLTINDRRAAVRAATEGLGIAMWVEHHLQEEIDSGKLVPLLQEWCPVYQGFWAYYYRDKHISAATRAVLDFLRSKTAAV
ncbi:LysR substrate-binding domain-containing protein [Sodalis sp. RH24]|uniref:LysR family transcriptional regulator n=1 Tax=unclassified Sodalis (in: enterobacteria) TaxID=2636512 RepID=UPI0039B6985C